LALLAGLPGIVVSLALLWRDNYSAKVQWTLGLVVLGSWLITALVLRERVVRPLQTLSNMLAALREVNAAVAISAPSNLVSWNGKNWHYYRDMIKLPTWEARRRASPYFRYRPGRSCPLLLMHGRPPDRIVHYWQSVRFARKDHLKLITLKHGHLKDPSAGPRAVRWADKQPGTGCAVRSP